jgi:1,2-diacylglycerol 3-alpha-glucosyltransferase
MRIALVTEIAAPYRIPQWNALAAATDGMLRVFLLGEHDPRRSYELERRDWRFDARVLPGRGIHFGGRWLVASVGVRRELDAFSPTVVVVGGWNQPAYFQAARHARERRIPLVVWVESTARDVRPGLAPLERLKRRMIGEAAGFLVPGEAAAEYLRNLGVDAAKIAVAPNTVDPELIARIDEQHGRRDELRRDLGLDGCCFLSVSRLSPEKGVGILVAAFEGVPGTLVVAGDGPERAKLRRAASANVRLLGNLPSAELVAWYAAADAFVLASRSETWGMALHEAAAAGLPLVASEAAGAGYDLIEPGVNGFRVAVSDTEALRRTLTAVATDEAFRARAAERSRELGRSATPARFADAVVGLVREVGG